jgi:hypothetical protein
MITNFKTSVNENLLVPRNIEGRKEKLKQLNTRLLSQEVIDGDLEIDESFMDIDPKFLKLKKVNGDVWLTGNQWTEIPVWLKDVEISGYFDFTYNKLTSLKNCPHKIGSSLYCYRNQLISLEGCPETLKGTFDCSYNKLKSLEGCPKNIGGYFDCSHNKLTSLKGCPENIEGKFKCHDNKTELELPDYVKLKGEFIN